ncbi:sialidase family protein [Opitutus terrae]|uniref:sialidase family protein n=1 Tax=Opitutus terrae TaxID=107709 RepID=UPI00192C660B|nr:sialidase family protein [Opitutus terrae]
MAADLFAPNSADLGLQPIPGARTFTVFRPDENTDHYSNGAVLIAFKERLYVQWQSSRQDEDSPDTWVAYSSSTDGERWTAPRPLSPPNSGVTMHSSGGWWTDGTTLVAFVNVWPTGFQSRTGGHAVYRLSTDGETWSAPHRLLAHDGQPLEGIIEQDPHAYDGRLHTAFHVAPGLTAQPHYTDDPLGLRSWVRGSMPHLPRDGATSRELEPSLFQRGAELVMVFRDQASTFRQLASVSRDRGETWSLPAVTNMPDSRAKQSAGNLPDGTVFLVNAPHAGRERIPLAATVSHDGRLFDRSFLLRSARDLQPLRYPGKFKRPGYHYPKSFVANGYLYVVYTTNKEDVELTRAPLAALENSPR